MKLAVKVMMTVFVIVLTAVCVYVRFSIVGAPFIAVLALAGIWESNNG